MPSAKVIAQPPNPANAYGERLRVPDEIREKQVNVFIYTQTEKFDLSRFSQKNSAVIQSWFHANKILVVTGRTSEEISTKIHTYFKKHPDKKVGTLWFDSHGVFKSGNSLFYMGKDTINHLNVKDSIKMNHIASLARYCDESSQIVIGSCYSNAEYVRPGNDKLTPSPMKGKELFEGISSWFPQSVLLGTESWVMGKPFPFGSKWRLAGYPMEIKFKDEIYKPVWETMGNWYIYQHSWEELEPVNTIYLTTNGHIALNSRNYLESANKKARMEKHVRKLKPGKYNLEK
jgi:hypothetical protein